MKMVAFALAPIVWLTGLSAAGKSTIARGVRERLTQSGARVEVLDGDSMRESVCRGLGFSREDRDESVRRIACVAELLSRHDVTVIVAAISPYREARAAVRARLANLVEVHVHCPLDVLEARDPKGLYARARRGEISNFTGISDPYEAPSNPDVFLNTAHQDAEESISTVLRFLNDRAKLHSYAPERY